MFVEDENGDHSMTIQTPFPLWHAGSSHLLHNFPYGVAAAHLSDRRLLSAMYGNMFGLNAGNANLQALTLNAAFQSGNLTSSSSAANMAAAAAAAALAASRVFHARASTASNDTSGSAYQLASGLHSHHRVHPYSWNTPISCLSNKRADSPTVSWNGDDA